MKKVCIVCGALFKEDKNGYGKFVEEHYFPCFNQRYNDACVKEVPNNFKRVKP